MGRLGERDRNAVVLRFFENKTAREVAVTLKINEAAAHKRVNRALDKLRKIFSKRGRDADRHGHRRSGDGELGAGRAGGGGQNP